MIINILSYIGMLLSIGVLIFIIVDSYRFSKEMSRHMRESHEKYLETLDKINKEYEEASKKPQKKIDK